MTDEVVGSDAAPATGRVRVMCDYCADGLWTEEGAAHPDDFPIAADLKARILDWQDWFERMDDDPTNWEFLAFNAEGRAIAFEMKLQLLDWTVLYFDSVRSARRMTPAPRAYFDYEIDTSLLQRLGPALPAGWSAWMIEAEDEAIGWCRDQIPDGEWAVAEHAEGWAVLLFAPGREAMFRLFREHEHPMRQIKFC